MRYTLTLISLLAVSTGSRTFAQLPPIMEKLLSVKEPIAQVTTEYDKEGRAFAFTDLSASQTTSFPTQMVRNDSALYLLVNGSGVLYRVKKEGDSATFVRLDNTSGKFHNQGSYLFTFKDTLWSLGGYGYWSFNGMLRKFEPETGDWEVRNINELKPVKVDGDPGNFFYHDVREGKIYATREYTIKQGLKGGDDASHDVLNRTSVLDMATMDWRVLGSPSEFFIKEVSTAKDVVSSPWGEFVYRPIGRRAFFLLDFKRNRIMEWQGFEGSYLDRYCKESLVDRSLFFVDSTLYVGSMRLGTLDSTILQYADFKDTGYPIYIENGRNSGAWYLILSLIALLVISSYFLVKKIGMVEKNRTTAKRSFDTVSTENAPSSSLFNPIEWSLIELLKDNTSKGSATTVADVNNVLGMARKSFEVQKKGRNQVMHSINGKAMATLKTNDALIERRRSEEDRRLSLYFINLEMLNELGDLDRQS